MRIVAGTHRSRPIETPPGMDIRPTADRVREALFNTLRHHLGGFDGVTVLDAFAGTGALGLEALSRGAAGAIFIDSDRAALALCRRNVEALGLTGRARLIQADSTRPPPAEAGSDLVFLDPPYGKGLAAEALRALTEAGWIAPGALIAIEEDRARPEPDPPGFERVLERAYGRTQIRLVRPSA